MPDDPTHRERLEREALEVVLAYYAGHEPLDVALRAILELSALPVPDGETPADLDGDEDPFLGLDLADLPPDQQARADALTRAIQKHLPDTA